MRECDACIQRRMRTNRRGDSIVFVLTSVPVATLRRSCKHNDALYLAPCGKDTVSRAMKSSIGIAGRALVWTVRRADSSAETHANREHMIKQYCNICIFMLVYHSMGFIVKGDADHNL